MFRRFFPVDYFVTRLGDVAAHYNQQGHRHTVSWTRGTLLRFLGCLLHMAVFPLPNHHWHWNFPSHLPNSAAPNFPLKSVISEMTFKRYW
jgi:hypothetical protein